MRSRLGIRGLELDLPLQHAGAGGGGLSFRRMAGVLQGDGEGGVGERIAGSEGDQRESRGNGGFKAARVAQGADQAVMGFNVGGIVGDSGAERAGGLGGFACGEQVKALLGLRVGSGVAGCGHGCFEDNGCGALQA